MCDSSLLGQHVAVLRSLQETKNFLKEAQLSQLRIRLEQDASDVARSEEIKIKTDKIADLITALDAVISENQLYERLAEPLQVK